MAFWRIYMNETYEAERYLHTGVGAWREVSRRELGGKLTRVIQGVPKRNLPAFVEKLTGKALGFTEYLTYDEPDHAIQIRIEPGVLPALIDIEGRFAVTADERGRAKRTCRGSVTIRVPIIGSRLEKFVVEDLRKSYEDRARLMRSWITQHPDEASAQEAM